jgi:hypothetical protein
MECEFNRTPYKRRLQNCMGARAPHSLDVAKKILGRHLQDEVWKNSKTHSEVLGRLQYTTTKSSGAYQIRSHGTAHRRTYSRIKDGTWSIPYTSCNYSYRSSTSRNRRKLPE